MSRWQLKMAQYINKAAEIGYNARLGHKSGTEKWLRNPLTHFPVLFPFLILEKKPIRPVPGVVSFTSPPCFNLALTHL